MDIINSLDTAAIVGSFAAMLQLMNDLADTIKKKRDHPLTICIEGPDRTGKTTLFTYLEGACNAFGLQTMYIRMPFSRTTRDILINDAELSPIERALRFLDELPYVQQLAQNSSDIRLILMDRNPIYSLYAYNYPLLSREQQDYITEIMTTNLPTYLIPDATYLFLHEPYERDETYIANTVSTEKIYGRYSAMSDLMYDDKNMGYLYGSDSPVWGNVPIPVELTEFTDLRGLPVIYTATYILENVLSSYGY